MEQRADPTPSLLPRPEHLAYVANLLTVLGILLGAYVVLREERARKRGHAPYGLDWRPA